MERPRWVCNLDIPEKFQIFFQIGQIRKKFVIDSQKGWISTSKKIRAQEVAKESGNEIFYGKNVSQYAKIIVGK